MFDESDISIPKDCPVGVLRALDKYADDAYNDVARNSELYGQEVAGFLYSPYFFRRFIPIQFTEGLTKWREDGKIFSLVDYLAKAIKIKSAANLTIGNPRDPRQVVYTTPSRIESDAPFVPAKELFDQLYSIRDYCGSLIRNYFGSFIQCPKAFRIVYELKSSGLTEKQITSVLTDFAYSTNEAIEIGVLTLRPASSAVERKYFGCNNEIAQRAYQNGAGRNSAKIIDAWFDYVNEIGVFGSDQFCRVVDLDRNSAFEFARVSRSPYFHLFLNELKTLAILERNGGFVFEERKNFLPLSLLQSIPVRETLTYGSALKSVLLGEGMQAAEDIAFSEDYSLCFLRAGIYYTIKNRIAFEGMDYHGVTDPESAFNTALDDVLSLGSEDALEDFAESEFFGEVAPSSGSAQPVNAFSSDGMAQPVNAFGSDGSSMGSAENAANPAVFADSSRRPIPPRYLGMQTTEPDSSTHAVFTGDPARGVTGSGLSAKELFDDLKDDPEFINMMFDYAKRKPGKFITNSKGEKAYAGDTVKVEWLAPTIFGSSYTGRIAEIHDNRIVFDDNAMQPLEGVRDFSIIK